MYDLPWLSWVMNPRGIFQPNQMLFDATDIAIGDAALGVVKTVPKVGFVTLAIDVLPNVTVQASQICQSFRISEFLQAQIPCNRSSLRDAVSNSPGDPRIPE
ncbi:MAG: hypothetical protein Ct9H300mP19_06040 [Dehalococcoidia bacterium]|nr:MAG: hypothetical protein Ct9H300mP19_06040 [Dehalococcoidia bacterium]